jgi:PAS domain S-box-containing protein
VEDDYLPLARIIGSNSVGALAFGDAAAALDTLRALSIKPHVVSARLYDAQGRPFATYVRHGAGADPVPAGPGSPGHRFDGDHLLIVHEVRLDGDIVGILRLRIETAEVRAALARSTVLLGLVFFVSTGVALALSSLLQKRISGPVLGLAAVARAVAQRRDYAVRARPAGPIELRALTEDFNGMLAQIQEREAALQAGRDTLEALVEARGRDLVLQSEERRKAEALNRLLSQAVASSRELVSISDLEDRIIFVNHAYVEAYGYSFEEALGKDGTLVDSPRNPPGLREAVAEGTRRGGWRGELWNRARDGREFPVFLTTSVIRDGTGAAVGLLGVASDVSEVRRTEERLQLQRTVLESTADAVVITESDGTITWVNPAFTRLTGYSAEEALGRKPSILRSGQQDEASYRELWQTVLAGEVWEGEMVNRRKDGSHYLEAQTITPVRDAAGAIAHFVSVKRDVSQRRRLEEQLRQAQKMEAVGRLSGGVAHDFNNVLNVIMGFSDLLLKRLPQDDRLRRHTHEILKAANRGAGLTRQLLAFSRQQVLQPKIVDLNTILTDIEKMLARLIGEDVDLVTSLAPDLGTVEVDPGQIEQVLMNLAVNARDAMPEGGTLAVETANVDLSEAEAGRHDYPVRPGPYVRLSVTDTGVGMDAGTKAHMFEPFFTTKAPGKGTGLGLATVYGIVKQSQGYVWVESEEGKGTTFQILLPRRGQAAAAGAKAVEGAHEPGGSETVLLAEDDDAARDLWREMLESLGYAVIEARNGAEALERASAHGGRIDVLLSDVVMPRMGGRELFHRLEDARPGLRVIFMSGYTADTMLRQGIGESGGAFLQKPFTAQQLAKKVRDVLDGKVPGAAGAVRGRVA